MQFFLIKRRNLIVLLFIIIFFIGGIYLGINHKTEIEKVTGISNKEKPAEINADFESFWKTWNLLNEKYPDINKISDQDKLYGAINGLVSSLDDPYSVFMKPEEKKAFEEDISGSFSGIGLEVGMRNKVLTVISPLKNTPAYLAGIKAGDKIIKIDNSLTADLNIEEAVKIMRGEIGTNVTLTIIRNGESKSKEIVVTRGVINVPTLDTELREDGIFIISLYNFSANSSALFKKALIEFSEAKTNKLVIDLRGNPGGYLDTAVNMASWFLPNGKTVLIEDYGNGKKQKIYRSLGYDVFSDQLKLIVLIDKGSASASEILAGALQDYKLAKIVGEQSYGKGSVQEVVNVTPDSLLKITIAKWLTPNGTSISEKGLTPDYEVELTEENIKEDKDPQMDKAVELLLQN